MNLDRARILFAYATLGLWILMVIASALSASPRYARLVTEVTVPMMLVASALFGPSIIGRRNKDDR